MNKINKNNEKFKVLDDNLPASDIPKSIKSTKLWDKVVKFQFIYSILGMITGIIFMVIGILLFINGLDDGNSELSIKILNSSFDIKKATPSGILFLVGLIIVFITKFKISAK